MKSLKKWITGTKMKREVYFMRHGESEANVLGVLCGSEWDANLSPKGIEQVKHAAQSLKNTSLQMIISSPLKRAMNSAQIVSQELLHSEFQISSNLQEQFYGEWEGRLFQEIKDSFLQNFDPPKGETHQTFKARIKSVFSEIIQLEGNILIVAHGGVGIEMLELAGLEKRLINNSEIIQLL